jgi:hypothetical protein
MVMMPWQGSLYLKKTLVMRTTAFAILWPIERDLIRGLISLLDLRFPPQERTTICYLRIMKTSLKIAGPWSTHWKKIG